MFARVVFSWPIYMSICECYVHARQATSELRSLMCSYDDKITRSCGDMMGCRLVLLKHASFMSTVNSSFNVGQVSIPFVSPSCCHMFSVKVRFSKLQTSFLVHTK